jgi:ribokinase
MSVSGPSAEVVVVGSYNQDIVLSLAHLPAPGETCLALGRTDVAGGKGANQAIQAARCGARVAMVAAVGCDTAGEEAMAVWARDGVDASSVARIEGHATGMGLILLDRAGENSIVVDSGANAALDEGHVQAASALISSARLTIAQLETSTAATRLAFHLARAAGVRTLLNAAPAPDEPLADDLLALADILVVNEGEGQRLSAQAELDQLGPWLLARVGHAVIVTLGSQGAVLFHKNGPPIHRPTYPVSVVDTTGAGDAFIGGFAACYAETGDLAGALPWGLAAGALACTLLGATTSFADRRSVQALVERRNPKRPVRVP